jgi:hypothetical protein
MKNFTNVRTLNKKSQNCEELCEKPPILTSKLRGGRDWWW